MRTLIITTAALALAVGSTSACATKKYVAGQVGQVSTKVDTLSSTLEQTQERTRRNEARIGEVDSTAQAAKGAAATAQQAALTADGKAAGAAEAARAVDAKVTAATEKFDKALGKMVYEVVISEENGNFKFGAAALPDEAKAKIDELIAKLLADPKGAYFEIEGHTDNVGEKATNQRLGMSRAESVKKYLYEQHKIPLHRMNIVSYGEEKPAVENKTRDGRAQNRRVVIRVLV